MAKNQKKAVGADILIPFLLLALVFGGLVWQKYRQAEKLPEIPPAQQGSAATKKVILFFGDNGTHLAREARQIEGCQSQKECLGSLLEELFIGPISKLVPLLPEYTTISQLSVSGDLATIDLSNDLADSVPSGSTAEMLAIYSIVNSICVNMPEISRVKINLDGNSQVRLKHLDLAEPLEPDYSLEETNPAEEKASR